MFFSRHKQKDQQFESNFKKTQQLITNFSRGTHQTFAQQLKNILNLILGQDSVNYSALFANAYQSAMKQTQIQWVPKLNKTLQLLSPTSDLLKAIWKEQDFKISIQKYLIPTYLSKNNLFNDKNSHLSLSNSIQGPVVGALDYLFIRLCYATSQIDFLPTIRTLEQEYQNDDLYFYLSRNPYLLLIRSYLDHYASSERHYRRLAANIKMFFVDQLLLKDRMSSSSNSFMAKSGFSSILSTNYRIKPHHFLVVFLLLRRSKIGFEQKFLYLHAVISKFNQLINKEDEIFMRIFIRIFLFAYNPNSVECQVIDTLQNANQNSGYYQIQRYSVKDFMGRTTYLDKRQAQQYMHSKGLLISLFETQSNFSTRGRIHLGLISSLGCLLSYTEKQCKNYSRNPHRQESQAVILEKILLKTLKYTQSIKTTKGEGRNAFSLQKRLSMSQASKQQLMKEVKALVTFFEAAYKLKINMAKMEDQNKDLTNRSFNIRGDDKDISFSLEQYQQKKKYSCWDVPLKNSEFEILYDLMHFLASKIDVIIPGHEKRTQPWLNLRYFSNPIILFSLIMLIVLFLKFWF